MKTSTFQKTLDELNLEMSQFPMASQRSHLSRIHYKGHPSEIVATVSNEVEYKFSTNHASYDEFPHKETLLQLLLDYSTTSISDRNDESKYELRLAGHGLPHDKNILMRTKKAVGKNHQKGDFLFGHDNIVIDNPHYKRHFTDRDIETFPDIWQSMINDGYLVKIEIKNEDAE